MGRVRKRDGGGGEEGHRSISVSSPVYTSDWRRMSLLSAMSGGRPRPARSRRTLDGIFPPPGSPHGVSSDGGARCRMRLSSATAGAKRGAGGRGPPNTPSATGAARTGLTSPRSAAHGRRAGRLYNIVVRRPPGITGGDPHSGQGSRRTHLSRFRLRSTQIACARLGQC